MKKIIVTTAIVIFAATCFVGCSPQPAQIDVNAFNTRIDELTAQVNELSDANERLADMYTDIEAENAELRKTNEALAKDNEALTQANEALANQEPQVITEYVETPAEDEYIECGACGAHVHDWWYVRNMADTEFVEVCQSCYEAMQD